MRRIYSKRTPRKNFFLTVVDDNTIRVKTTKISTSDLNVVKKACHVTDRRKTFDIARVDAREFKFIFRAIHYRANTIICDQTIPCKRA